jgi:hypothetical protein
MGRLINLTEQTFGKWIVLGRAENNKYGNARWECKCECGTRSVVRGAELRRGSSTSCGFCLKNKDLTGQTHGKWFVIKYVGNNKHRNSMWQCQCECGTISIISGSDLRTKKSTACSLICARKGKKGFHGLSFHPLYGRWNRIKQCCYNPKNPAYKRYGGIGIRMYEPWYKNPGTFINDILSSIGLCPPGKSLDRINPYGNYEPGNIRWATAIEQSNNTRRFRNQLSAL